MYTPDDVVEETIDEVKDELASILVLLDEYSNGVEAVLEEGKNELDEQTVKKYEDDTEYMMNEVKKHKKGIMKKKKEISPPTHPSFYL